MVFLIICFDESSTHNSNWNQKRINKFVISGETYTCARTQTHSHTFFVTNLGILFDFGLQRNKTRHDDFFYGWLDFTQKTKNDEHHRLHRLCAIRLVYALLFLHSIIYTFQIVAEWWCMGCLFAGVGIRRWINGFSVYGKNKK